MENSSPIASRQAGNSPAGTRRTPRPPTLAIAIDPALKDWLDHVIIPALIEAYSKEKSSSVYCADCGVRLKKVNLALWLRTVSVIVSNRRGCGCAVI